MSVANKTSNYNLPLFEETDKGNWFDLTPAMQTIDDEMKANELSASGASSIAENANMKADSALSTSSSAIAFFENEKLNVDISFTRGADVLADPPPVFSATTNTNKSTLNLYGGGQLVQKVYTEYPIVGKLIGYNVPTERILYNVGSMVVRFTENDYRTLPTTLRLQTDGTIKINFLGNLDNLYQPPTIDFNCMLNTLNWF